MEPSPPGSAAVLIRPWTPADRLLVESAQPYLSELTLSRRFLAGTGGRLPAGYLQHLAAGPRPEWDAQVAVAGGQLCGWAEYGRDTGTWDRADLAVIVMDRWQRHGIASALVDGLIPRMIQAGVRELRADVLLSNRPARRLMHALFGAQQGVTHADGLAQYRIPLTGPDDGHPGPPRPRQPAPREHQAVRLAA